VRRELTSHELSVPPAESEDFVSAREVENTALGFNSFL
jgi:hypothetical protein